MRRGAMSLLEDVGFMETDHQENIQMFLMPWLLEETVQNLHSHARIEEIAT